MAILKEIDKKLEKIYEKYKKDKRDITGWDFLNNLKKEAYLHEFLTSFFIYRIFEIISKKGEIINNPRAIKELIQCCYHSEKIGRAHV